MVSGADDRSRRGTITNDANATVTNYFIVTNDGTINNNGTWVEECGATFNADSGAINGNGFEYQQPC